MLIQQYPTESTFVFGCDSPTAKNFLVIPFRFTNYRKNTRYPYRVSGTIFTYVKIACKLVEETM
jgi:hypothetical protein